MIVDDEKHIVELIKFNLEKEGHNLICVYDGGEVINKAIQFEPEVIILDLMLPGMDGFEICKHLRRIEKLTDTHIIMLTAKDSELDKVVGLELGADDYITKPFSPRELTARVRARIRRKQVASQVEEEIYLGELIIKPSHFKVVVRGEEAKLTFKEFELLKTLVNKPGKVFTRDFLLDTVWGIDFPADTRTVDVHIRHLRQKIEENPAEPRYIETVRGLGYRFCEVKQGA
jgi:DNA-binding response OmpR family regulator